MVKEKQMWRKIDNTAKVFSLEDDKNNNIFRFSVVLKENINPKILKKAVSNSITQIPFFKVKRKSGVFWNYLEINNKDIKVFKENDIPCEHFDFKENNDYLFKVSYFKSKINVDFFHILTDGTGAIYLFKTIIYNYLELKYNKSFYNFNELVSNNDEYVKNYDKNFKIKNDVNKSLQIPDEENNNINNTYHYTVSINNLKKICKMYQVTITEYLTALYIYAFNITYNKYNEQINISLPVSLRKYYNVETLNNFFICININCKKVKDSNSSFEDILKEVKNEFTKKLTSESVKGYLARDVKLGMNIGVRLTPLVLKQLFIRYLGKIFCKGTTSTLSNVGIVKINEKYLNYIDNIYVLVMLGKIQKIKCTICSFQDNLNITINTNISNGKFENIFSNLIEKYIGIIHTETNIY